MKSLNALIADVVENGRVEIVGGKFDAASLEAEVAFEAQEVGYSADEAEALGGQAAKQYIAAGKAA